MGVDTETYRYRIGAFYYSNFGKREKVSKRSNSGIYSPQVRGSDIQYRVFWMCILIGLQMILAESLMLLWKKQGYRLYTEARYDPHKGLVDMRNIYTFTTTPYDFTSDSQYFYSGFAQQLLIIAGDVEINPGPLSDKEAILREIRSSKLDLMEEMKSVKQEIQTIKNEVAAVKVDNVIIMSNVSQLQNKQTNLDVKIANLEKDVDKLKTDNETLQLDVDHLSNELDRKTEIIDKLDRDIDQLESYSRRDTIRVFGLPELMNENYENIKQYVIDKILKVARPDICWSLKDIVRAHRVGSENPVNPEQPKILLVKFQYWDHKMDVYKGRDKLRENGIRIGDDLTRRQRHILKKFAERGKHAYYYKGQLQFKDQQSDMTNIVSSRTFRKAHRRQPLVAAVRDINTYPIASEMGTFMEGVEPGPVEEDIDLELNTDNNFGNEQSQSENTDK